MPPAARADGIRGVMTTARMSGYATDPNALQEYYQRAADGICVIVQANAIAIVIERVVVPWSHTMVTIVTDGFCVVMQVESPAAVAAIPEVRRSAAAWLPVTACAHCPRYAHCRAPVSSRRLHDASLFVHTYGS